MNHNLLTFFLQVAFLFYSCNQVDKKSIVARKEIISNLSSDKDQIKQLIRQVLTWADSKNSIEILPVLTDQKNEMHIGFNLKKHKQNLEKLEQTNWFTKEFIENYNHLILTLEDGLKNGIYDTWLVGELPSFAFANNVSPLCNCQDSQEWDNIEIQEINLTKQAGEFIWKWGNPNKNSNWNNFAYKFRVKKDNGTWKITYMSGFDWKESTRKNEKIK